MEDKHKAIVLMVLCTIFLSIGQYFGKIAGLQADFTIEGTLLNFAYYGSLIFAGMGAVLMTKALKRGDLSRIFPLVALSFVWTLGIAYIVFGEVITITKIIGVIFIIAGIIVLGRAGDTV